MAVLLPEIPEFPEISEERLRNKGKGWMYQAEDNMTGQTVFVEFAYYDETRRMNKSIVWYAPPAPGMRWTSIVLTAEECLRNYTKVSQ
jgi:hypothetical protein